MISILTSLKFCRLLKTILKNFIKFMKPSTRERSKMANLKRHFPFLCYFFCLEQVYFDTKSNLVIKCRLGLACADCAG